MSQTEASDANSPLLRLSAFWRKFFVTALALVVVVLGHKLPNSIGLFQPGQLEYSYQIALFAATVPAWMSAAAVVGFLCLCSHRVARLLGDSEGYASPLSRTTFVLAACLTVGMTLSWWTSYATFAEFAAPLKARNMIAAALISVAALACLFFIARMITEHGIGQGFWVIVAFMSANQFALDIWTAMAGMSWKLNADELIYGQWQTWVQFACIIIAICSAVLFVNALSKDGVAVEHAIWPWLLAGHAGYWGLDLAFAMITSAMPYEWLPDHILSYAIVDGICILIFTWIYAELKWKLASKTVLYASVGLAILGSLASSVVGGPMIAISGITAVTFAVLSHRISVSKDY